METTALQPWYRQFWPWFIIALPLTAVIGGIATWIIAAHNPDGLVADDYYKQGLAINQTLDRERRAQALGLSGLVRIDATGRRIVLTLEGRIDSQQRGDLVLHMIHPTRPHLDHDLTLHADTGNTWSAPLDRTAPGRWHLQLEPRAGDWRLTGRLALPEQQQARLQPND
ncbi:MAG: FixH family protein [Gammaproteobacteria bacterium]|nr:FixH family protein [Gammaproteobacteria bacterium]